MYVQRLIATLAPIIRRNSFLRSRDFVSRIMVIILLSIACREEDNDDVIAIVNGESTHLKELYGEYCISEIIRHPDCRRLIIGEDTIGSAVGVICLNSTIDVDLLNENFELTPYNGLKKPLQNDDVAEATGSSPNELPPLVFSRGNLFTREYLGNGYPAQMNIPDRTKFSDSETPTWTQPVERPEKDRRMDRSVHLSESSVASSNASRLTDLPSIPPYFDMYFQPKTTADAMFRSPNRKL